MKGTRDQNHDFLFKKLNVFKITLEEGDIIRLGIS